MELTQEQLGYLIYLVPNNGNILQEVLQEEFPKAEISLVIEYEYIGHKINLQGAFFSKEEARKAMATLPVDISLIPAYMYSVVSGAIKDLLKECSFGSIDEKSIYASLEQRLVEMDSRQD